MLAEEREFSNEMRKEALKWRVLIDDDDLQPAEHIELQAWLQADPLHAQALDRAETLLSAFGKLDERVIKPAYVKQSLLDRLRYVLADLTEQPLSIRTGAPLAAACTAMLAIGFVVLTQFTSAPSTDTSAPPVVTVYESGLGEMETIYLADESVLMLGPATRVEVSYSDAFRKVALDQGAVVFDVTRDPDRPFTVEAQAFSAKVLGTVFDVRNNGGVVRLSVSEGAVEARHPFIINDMPTNLLTRRELKAGEAVTATGTEGLSSKRTFRVETFAAWRDDRLRYNGATLNELVADANRYSRVPIIIEAADSDIAAFKATFTYDGRELDTMLASLPNLFPVTVDRTDEGSIIIRPADRP